MVEFITHFLGDMSPSFYAAALIFIFLGFGTQKMLAYKLRSNKELKFSLEYWLKDNLADVIIAFLLSFATVRFTDDILVVFCKYTNFDVSFITDAMFYYYVIGVSHQYLLHIARSRLPFLAAATPKTTPK